MTTAIAQGVLSPSALASGITDNYSPTGWLPSILVLRLTPDSAGSTLTGIASPSTGRVLQIFNISTTATLTLAHDITSTAANRFFCPGNADFSLQPNSGVDLWYDVTSSRWRVIDPIAQPNFLALPIVDGSTLAAADTVSASPTFAGTAAGRVLRANAAFAIPCPGWFVGVCVVGGTGNAGGTIKAIVQTAGVYVDAGAAFTPGLLYLNVAGTGRPVNTVPSGAGNRWVEVGIALSATSWLVQPRLNAQL